MTSTSPQLAVQTEPRAFGWIDAAVLLALLSLMWSALHFGKGMLVHFDDTVVVPFDSSPGQIPYYAARTMLRMWIAFCFSLFFAILTGYVAAKSRGASSLSGLRVQKSD
jgi:NitT/TauT family transport system permease protein